jgi:hypothetical protein
VATATVQAGGNEIRLSEQQRLTFGRARECTLCLDPEDIGISRVAGTIEFEHGIWWVANNSTSRPLSIVDDLGFRSVLAPQRRAALETTTQIIVEGMKRRHNLRVTVVSRHDERESLVIPAGASTAVGADVLVSGLDRLAMVALFAGYLADPPHYDPNPKSYAAAAARLGWKRSTLIKRIEYLRVRLDAAGVPNMMGFGALSNLAEYAISRGLITRSDLELLAR